MTRRGDHRSQGRRRTGGGRGRLSINGGWFDRLLDLGSDHRETAIGLAIIVTLGILGLLVIGFIQRLGHERAADPVTLCRLHQPAPEAVLILVDATDPLARENAPRFRALVEGVRDRLPRHGRLIIAPFGGDLGRPLSSKFDICSPGQRKDADPRTEGAARMQSLYESRFGQPLQGVIEQLSTADTSPISPIAEQIERAANDPALHWTGERRTLWLLTDGLQNYTHSVYRTGVVSLPRPERRFLAGVKVVFVELANPRDAALQGEDGRAAWRAWLEAAGASVEMRAAGYPDPEANH